MEIADRRENLEPDRFEPDMKARVEEIEVRKMQIEGQNAMARSLKAIVGVFSTPQPTNSS